MIDGLPWRFPELRGGAFARSVPQKAPREWSPSVISEILARHGVISQIASLHTDPSAVSEVWIVHGILRRYQLLLARRQTLKAKPANRRREIADRLASLEEQLNHLANEGRVLAQEYERLGPLRGRAGEPNSIRPLDGTPNLELLTKLLPEALERLPALIKTVERHSTGHAPPPKPGVKGRPWEFRALVADLWRFYREHTGTNGRRLTKHDDALGEQVLTHPGKFVADIINELVAAPSAPISARDLRGIRQDEGAKLGSE
ncbi:hypothetical protein [Geminicoccus flavidas]|uniref:hypothetical protein n=1 Tax=Geminicoccus flavidas TaxID=2506407 RepID=UPI00135BD01D|nr:hypothetical protein [Geminicoccus flavidas]